MRTAIVSDLHLGAVAGSDLLRDPTVRAVLLDELRGAERLVLLGDALELRERPLGAVLEHALPFFSELGAALGETEVVLVPGNHDARLAEPLLDGLSILGEPLDLDAGADPSPGPTAALAAALGPARLRIAYPGIWLREDVYATHGNYMDVHLTLPRAECVALAAVRRRPRPRDLGPSEAAWEVLAGDRPDRSRSRRVKARAARAAFPLVVAGVNRLLDADFDADVSGAAIFRSGVVGATEMARRLGVDGGHVITGHTHRGGPRPDEGPWRLPGSGELHNTGNWVFSTPLHSPGEPPNSYWPGTVTWLEDSGPPRRVDLLRDRTHHELVELVAAARGIPTAAVRPAATRR
jgi:hypothetical protein